MTEPIKIKWWKQENREDILRELWPSEFTTTEIGKKLEISKDKVIGKAHRMKLGLKFIKPREIKPKLEPQPRLIVPQKNKPEPRVNQPTRSRPNRMPINKRGSMLVQEFNSYEDSEPVEKVPRIRDVRKPAPALITGPEKSCQWITVASKPPIFCDAVYRGRGSYCPQHAEISRIKW